MIDTEEGSAVGETTQCTSSTSTVNEPRRGGGIKTWTRAKRNKLNITDLTSELIREKSVKHLSPKQFRKLRSREALKLKTRRSLKRRAVKMAPRSYH